MHYIYERRGREGGEVFTSSNKPSHGRESACPIPSNTERAQDHKISLFSSC